MAHDMGYQGNAAYDLARPHHHGRYWPPTRDSGTPILPPPANTVEQLSTRIFEAAQKDLFYTIPDKQDPTRPRTAVLNLATMSRMSLQAIQFDLAQIASTWHKDPHLVLGDGKELMVKSMAQYCEALKNTEYIQTWAARDPESDPFRMSSDHALERTALESVGLIPGHVKPCGALPRALDAADPTLLGTPRYFAVRQLFKLQMVSRFIHAFGGGLALVVPMLIMVYVPGTTASVATTCAFMFMFALVIALKTRLGPNEVLAVTSAYAAVLVVFVGVRLDNLS